MLAGDTDSGKTSACIEAMKAKAQETETWQYFTLKVENGTTDQEH